MDCPNECVHLVIDAAGLVVNRIVTGPSTPDDWEPGFGLTLLPHTVQGGIGGTYIGGIYMPPSEPENEDEPEE